MFRTHFASICRVAQPRSGCPANFAAYTAVVEPNGRIMGLEPPDGRHTSHGFSTEKKKVSATSIFFQSMPYKVDAVTGFIDYGALSESTALFKPQVIIAGMTSCHTRHLDYARFRRTATSRGVYYLMSAMAHISFMPAVGLIPSPFRQCSDIVTTTTHKSLRGPRGALIFYCKGLWSRSAKGEPIMYDLHYRIDVFPGLQGGPHNHTISAIAVALEQAKTSEFVNYQRQVLANAQALSNRLIQLGYTLATGGTENHLCLVDLRPLGIDGSRVETVLEMALIACNKNTCPGDKSALKPGGIRLGTPALTSRDFKEADSSGGGRLPPSKRRPSDDGDTAMRRDEQNMRDFLFNWLVCALLPVAFAAFLYFYNKNKTQSPPGKDVFFQADGEKVFVNKEYISAWSAVLKACLNPSDILSSLASKRSIVLSPRHSLDDFRAFVTAIEPGPYHMCVNESNVGVLIAAAEAFDVENLRWACDEYLVDHFDPADLNKAIKVLIYSTRFDLQKLRLNALNTVARIDLSENQLCALRRQLIDASVERQKMKLQGVDFVKSGRLTAVWLSVTGRGAGRHDDDGRVLATAEQEADYIMFTLAELRVQLATGRAAAEPLSTPATEVVDDSAQSTENEDAPATAEPLKQVLALGDEEPAAVRDSRAVCFKCRLVGAAPSDGASEWSAAAKSKFAELLPESDDGAVELEVVGVGADGLVSVRLPNVAAKLVEAALAAAKTTDALTPEPLATPPT